MDAVQQKKKGKGCLWAIAIFLMIVAIAMWVGMNSGRSSSSETSNIELTPAQWLEFDAKSWEDFTKLYKGHNYLINSMTTYSEGRATKLDFYNYCKEAEAAFANSSLSYNYGENEEQKTYLSNFKSLALSDQSAAKYLMKYLDSGKMEDLSRAQENIEAAKEAAVMVASNRGILLTKYAKLSDEELKEKIESDMAELDTMLAE